MSHTELAETAESEISLQSVSPDWRKRLLFSDFSVDSSEAHEPLTWFGAGGREIKNKTCKDISYRGYGSPMPQPKGNI